MTLRNRLWSARASKIRRFGAACVARRQSSARARRSRCSDPQGTRLAPAGEAIAASPAIPGNRPARPEDPRLGLPPRQSHPRRTEQVVCRATGRSTTAGLAEYGFGDPVARRARGPITFRDRPWPGLSAQVSVLWTSAVAGPGGGAGRTRTQARCGMVAWLRGLRCGAVVVAGAGPVIAPALCLAVGGPGGDACRRGP